MFILTRVRLVSERSLERRFSLIRSILPLRIIETPYEVKKMGGSQTQDIPPQRREALELHEVLWKKLLIRRNQISRVEQSLSRLAVRRIGIFADDFPEFRFGFFAPPGEQ